MAGTAHMIDKPILIGSSVSKSIIGRIPNDIDFIGSNTAISNLFENYRSEYKVIAQYPTSANHLVLKLHDFIVEAEIAFIGSSGQLIIDWVTNTRVDSITNNDTFVAAPDLISWMLKESHKYKDSVHFEKTRNDVLKFRQYFMVDGVEETESMLDKKGLLGILKLRESETYRPHVKLNVNKDEFFANDGIPYIIDHDLVHDIVAIGSAPAYKSILAAGSAVMCSKTQWAVAPDLIKSYCVLEEAMVIALERGVIPFGKLGQVDDLMSKRLFVTAMQKICTTLTSGWFREYAWENYDRLIQGFMIYEQSFNHNFAQRFAMEYGTLK